MLHADPAPQRTTGIANEAWTLQFAIGETYTVARQGNDWMASGPAVDPRGRPMHGGYALAFRLAEAMDRAGFPAKVQRLLAEMASR